MFVPRFLCFVAVVYGSSSRFACLLTPAYMEFPRVGGVTPICGAVGLVFGSPGFLASASRVCFAVTRTMYDTRTQVGSEAANYEPSRPLFGEVFFVVVHSEEYGSFVLGSYSSRVEAEADRAAVASEESAEVVSHSFEFGEGRW